MHAIKQQTKFVSRQAVMNEYKAAKLGDNIANHMAYIYMIILYDKFDFSFKQICNFNEKLIALRNKYQDDNDSSVTSDSLYKYVTDKNLRAYEFVKSIPMSEKLFLADVKKGGVVGADRHIEAAFLKTLMLTIPVLKKNYKFSNDKIFQFYKWVRYYVDSYYRKQPGTNKRYCTDEIIRGAFIEDEGYDIKNGCKVS